MSGASTVVKETVHAVLRSLGVEAEEQAVKKIARKVAPKPLAVVRPASPAIVRRASGANRRAAAAPGIDREALRERYPETGPPVWDEKRKPRPGFKKVNTPEANAVAKELKRIQTGIDAGGYTPLFDPKSRFNVDAADYHLPGNTLTDTLAARQSTIDKYDALARDPEAFARLRQAYEHGAQFPGAHDWYAMGQLEDAYKQALGPDLGRLAYKYNFANPMAATTGGADPKANLRMALYGNFLKHRGLEVPEKTFDYPYPIGGQYAGNNMEQFTKLSGLPDLNAAINPKRFNFSGDFMGHSDKATLDEQMSGLWDKKMQMPPKGSYGVYEKALGDLAQDYGVAPMNFQDVAWAGAKHLSGNDKSYVPMPMINVVNQMIERNARLTGVDPEEAFNDIFLRSGPGYAKGGLV